MLSPCDTTQLIDNTLADPIRIGIKDLLPGTVVQIKGTGSFGLIAYCSESKKNKFVSLYNGYIQNPTSFFDTVEVRVIPTVIYFNMS